ncbi:hypothetical protein NRIC0767_05990 [Lactobacillus delbrueckii subsp. allosunkii]|nr:hypothetical protein NRIC0766_11860 [Lactobacillus delbrueckii subsp. sunkii]GHN14338.1 hypothetical protein NRIC0767_05990 [Lactobacillus delbrueckii subsp. sunkii]
MAKALALVMRVGLYPRIGESLSMKLQEWCFGTCAGQCGYPLVGISEYR